MTRQIDLPVEVVRNVPSPAPLSFTKFFKGFERVQAVRSVFGEETDAVLRTLKVGFISLKFMYMGIRDEDGSITIGTYHLRNSDLRTLYLDIVHELFHIKQWRENRKYFEEEHKKFLGDWSLYYSSPIEVPAYKHTVREAERIGMSLNEIVEHLKMGPVPPKAFAKFLKEMELGRGPRSSRRAKLPVRINRKASVPLVPFTDCFRGFEKVAAVRALFGKRTNEVLNKLKVELVYASFIRMIPSDSNGHLLVGTSYLKSGDIASIYLDVLLCLNMLKRTSEGGKLNGAARGELQDSRPLLESYRAMLQEANRIGVPKAKVVERMDIPRFQMTPAGYKRFLRKLGFDEPNTKSSN